MKTAIRELTDPDIILSPASENIRYRHVVKGSDHYYILFNEEYGDVTTKFTFPVTGRFQWLDPYTAQSTDASAGEMVSFLPHDLKLLGISRK